eukprot:TRINITY_DN5581_c2_g1_i2.p1 TRINITY_DN5581_c2_g1~~TRINITY_DN5581_c2_g1_i2.p1  ORF type:complete len:546 (+),score=142.80 TRINITY_DN5581_c2_g1_i2:1387-3024(+)
MAFQVYYQKVFEHAACNEMSYLQTALDNFWQAASKLNILFTHDLIVDQIVEIDKKSLHKLGSILLANPMDLMPSDFQKWLSHFLHFFPQWSASACENSGLDGRIIVERAKQMSDFVSMVHTALSVGTPGASSEITSFSPSVNSLTAVNLHLVKQQPKSLNVTPEPVSPTHFTPSSLDLLRYNNSNNTSSLQMGSYVAAPAGALSHHLHNQLPPLQLPHPHSSSSSPLSRPQPHFSLVKQSPPSSPRHLPYPYDSHDNVHHSQRHNTNPAHSSQQLQQQQQHHPQHHSPQQQSQQQSQQQQQPQQPHVSFIQPAAGGLQHYHQQPAYPQLPLVQPPSSLSASSSSASPSQLYSHPQPQLLSSMLPPPPLPHPLQLHHNNSQQSQFSHSPILPPHQPKQSQYQLHQQQQQPQHTSYYGLPTHQQHQPQRNVDLGPFSSRSSENTNTNSTTSTTTGSNNHTNSTNSTSSSGNVSDGGGGGTVDDSADTGCQQPPLKRMRISTNSPVCAPMSTSAPGASSNPSQQQQPPQQQQQQQIQQQQQHPHQQSS